MNIMEMNRIRLEEADRRKHIRLLTEQNKLLANQNKILKGTSETNNKTSKKQIKYTIWMVVASTTFSACSLISTILLSYFFIARLIYMNKHKQY